MPNQPKLAGLDGVVQRALISILAGSKREALDGQLFRRLAELFRIATQDSEIKISTCRYCLSLKFRNFGGQLPWKSC